MLIVANIELVLTLEQVLCFLGSAMATHFPKGLQPEEAGLDKPCPLLLALLMVICIIGINSNTIIHVINADPFSL